MGAVDDYINGLEGKTDLNPLEVARDLLALHQQETGIRDAKIEELTGAIAEKDGAIQSRDTEITQWKAKNFDLAMQIPTGKENSDSDEDDRTEINGANIRVADLFSESVRNRHAFG